MSFTIGLENLGDAWLSVSDGAVAVAKLNFELDGQRIAIETAAAQLAPR